MALAETPKTTFPYFQHLFESGHSSSQFPDLNRQLA